MAANPTAPANQPHPPKRSGEPRVPSADRALEARLDALLADPIVRLLMTRDGVERDALVRMAQRVRREVREARGEPRAE